MSDGVAPDADLPEGSIPLAALLIVSYLNSEGENCYMVGTKGDASISTYLGLTVLGQQQLMDWAP